MSARTKDALIEALGLALRAVSAKDTRGFFASCGYREPRRSGYERRCQNAVSSELRRISLPKLFDNPQARANLLAISRTIAA
jgi:hypothetical protein